MILRHALFLYRRDNFFLASAYKQSGLFFVTSAAFVMSLLSNMHDPSLIIKYGRPFAALIAICYPIMNTYFGMRSYAMRKNRFFLEMNRRKLQKRR